MLNQLVEKINTLSVELESEKEKRVQKTGELESISNKITTLATEIATIEQNLKSSREELTKQKASIATFNKRIKVYEAEIAKYRYEIEKQRAEAKKNNSAEEEKRERELKSREIEFKKANAEREEVRISPLISSSPIHAFICQKKKKAMKKVAKLEEDKKNSLGETKKFMNDLEEARKALEKSKAMLAQLKKQQENTLLFFGQDAPAILAELKKNISRFEFPPIGPLGLMISLKDPKWSLAVERQLQYSIKAYLVHSKKDEDTFKAIVKRLKL